MCTGVVFFVERLYFVINESVLCICFAAFVENWLVYWFIWLHISTGHVLFVEYWLLTICSLVAGGKVARAAVVCWWLCCSVCLLECCNGYAQNFELVCTNFKTWTSWTSSADSPTLHCRTFFHLTDNVYLLAQNVAFVGHADMMQIDLFVVGVSFVSR